MTNRLYEKRLHFEGVPDDLIRKHYHDLCHGAVSLNIFSDSVDRYLFPHNPDRATDYVHYLVTKRDERLSSRIARCFLALGDAVFVA